MNNVRRFVIGLGPDERMALAALAERERRQPRAQAEMLLRDALERSGLLQPECTQRTDFEPAATGA